MNFQRLFALIIIVPAFMAAQDITARGRVSVIHASKEKSGSGNVVVWLTPTFRQSAPALPSPVRLIQKDKRFFPHVVAIRVGTEVEFPNQDPFFHDVFSIYHGRPFDLGLYESGASRKIRFSKGGVSYIFCNIHPEMSAAVVDVPTPYFGVTSEDGSFQIGHLVKGRYTMAFWYELSAPAELDSLTREIDIDVNPVPINVDIHSSDLPAVHLNKYGQEYPVEKTRRY
jgi:plastocyanin